ncbi:MULTISPECIES: hypothetical protein [Dermabacter]|uniref:Transposase n=1 Tax=Dermabacter hominis 1368 TaxID=1450519 RepID=A0ABR4SIL1_9MICO|nr:MULTISPECIES: hypothetical protein [Dermabacter]EPH15113.1 hypothetical protein HMPREF1484_00738 [Dermabacter sp. HFH0086]KDS92969.1 hypothetical protein DHOM_08185 [Dermabacter hominis 1368]MDU4924182.1 hypothetical protein [Dermabacter sp.]
MATNQAEHERIVSDAAAFGLERYKEVLERLGEGASEAEEP